MPEYVPNPEHIAISIKRLGLISRWAGFGGIVVGGYDGEGSEMVCSPTDIVGISGTGTATKVVVESMRSELQDPHETRFPSYNWPVARLLLNKTVLKERTTEDERDITGAYAKSLDQGLREGLLHAANKNLLAHERRDYLGIVMTAATIPIYPIWYAVTLANELHGNKQAYGSTLISRKRWSLMPWPSVQPDRFVLAAGALKTGTLITTRDISRGSPEG